MPNWLTGILKWGGAALAIVFAIALVYVELLAPTPAGGETSAPLGLYWVLLVVGIVAAIAGLVLDRRKGPSTS